jgi:hypothetical protein
MSTTFFGPWVSADCALCGASISTRPSVQHVCLTDGTTDAKDLRPGRESTKGVSRTGGSVPALGDSVLSDSRQAGSQQIGDPRANDDDPGVPTST